MESSRKLLSFAILFSIVFSSFLYRHCSVAGTANTRDCSSVHVGVILDLGTIVGKRSRTSISLAIDEFYKLHRNFSTKIALHFRDSSGSVLGATSSAIDLLTSWDVQAIIIGHVNPDQAHVIASLGNQAQIPILLLSAQPVPIASFPFLIHGNLDAASQATSIAALAKHFRWSNVVPIFEESEYSIGVVFSFLNALQMVGIIVPVHVVIPTNANDTKIENELLNLKAMQANIFLTCTMPDLASRLYQHASRVGLMEDGYAWIATNSIASMIETLGSEVIDAMQGLIGIRPHMPSSASTSYFTKIFITRFSKNNPESKIFYPTMLELLAYDTTWAIAVAAEKLDIPQCSKKSQCWNCSRSFNSLAVSHNGRKLLDAIQNTNFNNWGYKYHLVNRQLQFSSLEMLNVVAKSVIVRDLCSSADFGSWSLNTTSNCWRNFLKPIVWPGHTVEVPKSWLTRTNGEKLKIILPCSRRVDVCLQTYKLVGYCIDIFEKAIEWLPYPVEYEYIHPTNWTNYNDLIEKVYNKEFDAFVGDVTITANRSLFVDFTQPLTDPGLAMVVSTKKKNKTWTFLEPLNADLWFASLGFFFFTGFVIWAIEHRINPEFRGPPCQQVGKVFYFVFSTLFFSHKENLHSNLSRFAIAIWLFVVLVLTTSYTASFTSMLTVEQLKATSTDVEELIRRGDYVGYQFNSPVGDVLKRLGFNEFKVKEYQVWNYATALTQGSSNGGVAAIIDDIPYLKFFMSNHCDNEYKMFGVKPSLSHTTGYGGFGFAFQKNSPFTQDVSRAILELKESEEMKMIEIKWFQKSASCQDERQEDSQSLSSLSIKSFAGLFIITGVTSGLMLITHLVLFTLKEWDIMKLAGSNVISPWQRVCAWIKHFDNKDFTSSAFKSCDSSSPRIQHMEAQPSGMDSENAVSTQLEITADVMTASSSSEQLAVTPADTDTDTTNF